MRDSGVCRFERLLRAFVAVVIGTGVRVVHADTADEGALAKVEGESREEVSGGDVDCCIVRGCSGAVGESAGDDAGVDCFGAGEGIRSGGGGGGSVGEAGLGFVHRGFCVAEGGFKREGVGREPI